VSRRGGAPIPNERVDTLRQALRQALELRESMTLRDLSTLCGIAEHDLPRHLEHLRKSLRREGMRITIEPSICLECDFRFSKRERFARPGRCPRCRKTRISQPMVTLAG